MELVLVSLAVVGLFFLILLCAFFVFRIVKRDRVVATRRVVGETTAHLGGIPVTWSVYQLQGRESSGAALVMDVRMSNSPEDGRKTYAFSRPEAVAFVALLEQTMPKARLDR
jgi:hypothetical protein